MFIYARIPKSKPKLKPKKEREDYDAWLKKHGVDTSKKRVTKLVYTPVTHSKITEKTETRKASYSGMMGVAALSPQKVYTGDKMLGIATMHKSNAVPVFSFEEAQDISKMRRG